MNILLLTNKNSDNLGDQVMEICDLSLLQTAMRNLQIEDYQISSYDAEFIYSDEAQGVIQDTDLVFLGGGPLFNYIYQDFYKRTILTVELAEKYNKPVVFSAVGIDNYDEDNFKCQELKKAVNSKCVRQITTRDGYEFLKNYKMKESLTIGLVSDPAVWAFKVFDKFKDVGESVKKKIGIFVLRAEGFLDNGIDFPREAMAKLYKRLIEELAIKGYDYELITSGHYADEAFLDFLIRWEGIDADKCVFNMNTPEQLVKKISSYDGVISCRLHPSIIAYSLGVPSLGLAWNSKVQGFYNAIGYPERTVFVDHTSAVDIVEQMEKAMFEGVQKNESYFMSSYESVFSAIRTVIDNNKKDVQPYGYSEILRDISSYQGTSETGRADNLKRKFRRTYKAYNDDRMGYKIIYNGGIKAKDLTCNYNSEKGEIKKLDTGSLEYWDEQWVQNNGRFSILKNCFSYPECSFVGWRMRIKLANKEWYWYMEDDTVLPLQEYKNETKPEKRIFKDEEILPVIPLDDIQIVVLEAVWRKTHIKILYNSGLKSKDIHWKYDGKDGEVHELPSGSFELDPLDYVNNDGTVPFKKNKFVLKGYQFKGWNLRVRVKKSWFWYMSDGTLFSQKDYRKVEGSNHVQLFRDESKMPLIEGKDVELLVADALWDEKEKNDGFLHLHHNST